MLYQYFKLPVVLTVGLFLGIFICRSPAQESVPAEATRLPDPGQNDGTNSLSVVLTHPQWNGIEQEKTDDSSFASIVEKAGTARTESILMSPRVLTADSLLYLNRDPEVLRNPYDLETRRGEWVYRTTALQSLGDYLEANHPDGVIGFFRETFFDYSFDKRIVSPLSPVYAGDPGTANTSEKDGTHVGLRNLASTDPKGFVAISDKAELDLTAHGPAFVVRNPIRVGQGKTLVTALAVEYPDWDAGTWSLPRVGATLAYLYRAFSINLTASAGWNDFELSPGHTETEYEQRIMLYAKYVF